MESGSGTSPFGGGGSFKLSPGSIPGVGTPNTLSQTYANRAASAIKASGALARIGKGFFGSPSPSASVRRDGSEESLIEQPSMACQYTARSGIIAMAPSSSRNSAAISGKDFFQILKVGNNGITVSHDLRGTSGTREFDKIYVVTTVKWGYQMYSRHIALSNSGGSIHLYNIDRLQESKSWMQYTDSNRSVNSLAFSPTAGYMLFSGSSDGTVRMWDLRESSPSPALTFGRNGDSAREVQCSPFDAKKFAVIYDSGVIQRWDIRQPSNADRRMNAHSGVGLSLDWHPEKDYIVSGGRDQQIQVWNLASESRNPDYVIYAPSAVAKVRWLSDFTSNIKNILDTNIASCGRSKSDYKLYIWNLRRPYVPVHTIEQHTDAITDIHYRRDRFIWSVSKDKTFFQHNLASEPLTVDNLTSRAFDWSASNELLFVVQDDDTINEAADRQILCNATFPGYDPDVVDFYAQNYTLFPKNSESLVELCQNNANVAAKARRFRTSHVWTILANSVLDEQNRFRAIKPVVKPSVPDLKGSKVAELLSSHSTSRLRNASLERSRSRSRPPELRQVNPMNELFVRENVIDEATSSTVDPVNIPDKPVANPPILATSEANYSSFDTPGSFSPDDSYGIRPPGGASYTHISMLGTGRHGRTLSMTSGSHVSGGSTPEGDIIGKSIAEWKTKTLDDIKEDASDLSTPMTPNGHEANNNHGIGSKLSAALNRKASRKSIGSTILSRADTIEDIVDVSPYHSFLNSQTSPWRTERLVAKAAEFAMEQGDVQLCAVLATMFLDDYPRICPRRVAEEWIMSYITLLKRRRMFAAAAELIKTSQFKSIRDMGQTETSIDILCHMCMTPLSENANAKDEGVDPESIGFWYCKNCRKLLDGCSLCRLPLKGLAVVTLDCGHKTHRECMKEWIFEARMVDCPTGCGNVIVKVK